MARRTETKVLEETPLWYKSALIYELHVKSFCDSDGDGIGDFAGLTQKLDYLQDLGVTALWLLPFYPSPLKDDGYDISDYSDVHPSYGTLRDFQTFLREAHRRGLRVITELVLNHTSDQHAWFQRARTSPPGSRYRNFYVWSDSPDLYRDARIIFKDFETSNWTWDPVAHAYFWHRFYSHQPDLNFDSPSVLRAITQVLDFWLGMGVDGLRLDAVPYLFERDGTMCENLPETHEYLRQLRRHVDQKYRSRLLLAEANQWPADAIAYFGQGDECHMAYHFPLMPRLFMAIRMEDRYPIVEILQQTPPIPDSCQWALFLRNHDELTLEMVTDEDRDYMYRVYARDPQMRINLGIRRRLAPLLGNHRRRIELMKGLLFSLPGTPVLYYVDELGMGDNIYVGDRNGVRTPMQWSADRNAGFSRANPQRLYLPPIIDPEYHYETVNVEAQQANPHSLLWWMKRLIALRRRYRAFGHGSIEFLYPENRKVLAFVRRYQDECVLVVANLSRFVQPVELDLSAFQGMVPVELFGRTALPAIADAPYFLTLGPHSFYWFGLERQRVDAAGGGDGARGATGETLPAIATTDSWTAVFSGRSRAALELQLPDYLRGRPWFGGKARTIQEVKITDTIPLGTPPAAVIVLANVRYIEGDPEIYVLPLTYHRGEMPHAGGVGQAVCQLSIKSKSGEEEGLLVDALTDRDSALLLLRAMGRHRSFRGEAGDLTPMETSVFRSAVGVDGQNLEPSVLRAEQTNTSVVYGNRLILKLFRRLEEGPNPDLEIGRFLTERASYAHVPRLAGALEYRVHRAPSRTVAVLHTFVPNEGDAWQYTLDELCSYYERVAVEQRELTPEIDPSSHVVDLVEPGEPEAVAELVGPYLESAALLGERTAELHLALASDTGDPSFAPEPFTDFYRQGLYHRMLSQADQALQLLLRRLRSVPAGDRPAAERLLALQSEVRARFEPLRTRRITAMRIRCHGDYHLGQVLYTGKDFVIIDFEGEPARALSERKIKRVPLRDVAGMLRSFHYVAGVGCRGQMAGLREGDSDFLAPWARVWTKWVSRAFLKAYTERARNSGLLPEDREDFRALLEVSLLEKALYELSYELNNRPEWAGIPIGGILEMVESRA